MEELRTVVGVDHRVRPGFTLEWMASDDLELWDYSFGISVERLKQRYALVVVFPYCWDAGLRGGWASFSAPPT
jgi:hypothetical protein